MGEYQPPRPATQRQTGGFGFTYADRVAARILLAMLSRTFVLGREGGYPVEVRFEQRPLGELFDDLVIISDNGAKWAVTIKSADVVNNSKIDGDLVKRAWYILDRRDPSEPERSLLVIAQPPPSGDELFALGDLIQICRERPSSGPEVHLAQPYVTNDFQRSLWESLKASEERDPKVLLASLRLLTFDLDPYQANDIADVRKIAEGVVADPSEWEHLWNALQVIASEARGIGAEISADRLILRLPSDLLLRDFGDAEEDFASLATWGANYGPRNRQIGGHLSIDNSKTFALLDDATSKSSAVMLVGESGIGKSVALKEWSEATGAIYFRSDALEEPSISMRKANCRRGLRDLLQFSRRRSMVIIFDQIDRLEEDKAWADFKAWLYFLNTDSRVKLVFGCATGVSKIRVAELSSLLAKDLLEVTLRRSPTNLLNSVRSEFPLVAEALRNYAPSPILATPRTLDQLLRMHVTEWPTTFKQYLGQFWLNRVQDGRGDGPLRSEIRRIAAYEAERGIGILPDDINPDVFRSLSDRDLLSDDGNRISWDHDSTGDYIRAQMLLEADCRGDLGSLLPPCILNPLWRRALRLFFISVLEEEGLTGFERVHVLLENSSSSNLLELALFDAVVDCPPKAQIPTSIAPILKRDPKVMRRFVSRFIYSASSPEKLSSSSSEGNIFARAYLRAPDWTKWLPTAKMIVGETEWFASNGPALALEVLLPYLRAAETREDFLGAARPGLLFAYLIKRKSLRHGSIEEKDQNLSFQAGIACLAFAPKSASKFLRRSAGRIGRTPSGRRSDDEMSDHFSRLGKFVEPWPLGPKAKIDDAFQNFYLSGGWSGAIARSNVALAIELFLACLIQEPGFTQEHWFTQDSKYGMANDHNLPFFPPTHKHPAINSLFDASFEDGVEAICKLVDFAVSRWMSQYPDGSKIGIPIRWGDIEKFFAGDSRIYHCFSGSSVAPYALQSMLLTLEHRLLDLPNLDVLTEKILAILDGETNLAILAVLISVGKARPELLLDTLAPVLFSEAIDSLDIESSIDRSFHFIAGVSARNEYWRDQQEAYRFSRLPHRQLQLRNFAPYFLLYGKPDLAEPARHRWLSLAQAADHDVAHRLRVLAALYDRSKVTAKAAEGGKIQVGVSMPQDLVESMQEYQNQSAVELRRIALPFNINKALEDQQGTIEASDLLDDIEDAANNNYPGYELSHLQIGVCLVCLRAALEGTATRLGDANECRKALQHLIEQQLDSPSPPNEYVGLTHWTVWVSRNADLIFGPRSDTEDHGRLALVALIQSCRAVAFHAAIKCLRRDETNRPLCRTILCIGRDWAVESVRRAQAAHFAMVMNSSDGSPLPPLATLVPSSLDLKFNDKVESFVANGIWDEEPKTVLGMFNPESGLVKSWAPSEFQDFLPGLLEMLETTEDGDFHDSLLFLLSDVLEALSRRDVDDGPQQVRRESWRTLGAVTPNLRQSAQSMIIGVWSKLAASGQNDAFGFAIDLLKSYSRGNVNIESASRVFVEMLNAYRLNPTADSSTLYLRCFGIDDLGFSVEWDTEVGKRWVLRHVSLYSEMFPDILSDWRGIGQIFQRLRREEFRPLDSALLNAIIGLPSIRHLVKGDVSGYFAELLVELAPIVKGDPNKRDNWRRFLAELEIVGDTLAWQVLTEVSDRL